MTNWQVRQRRKAEVGGRAKQPNHMYSYCRILGCKEPARAGTGDGLDTRYCRRHADHYQRHGSPTKQSYPAKVLNPYRRAALEWLTRNEQVFWVKDAVGRVEGLYRAAGQHIEAFRLTGLSPKDRAKAAWARLRQAGVDPRLVIAAWLAIELAVADDPQPDRSLEFRRVQGAKLIHRMASGTHKRWEREKPNPLHPGLPPVVDAEEKHWYPMSRGQVLRHIGEALQGAVELLADHHLGGIAALKEERDLAGQVASRPYPKGFAARRRT